jgi:phosphatidylinositol 4-phosphatase
MMRPFSLGRRLISGMDDTREAVRRHFERELSIYQQQCIVSLVEQNGKEKVIDDAYLEHIRLLNEPRLIYVTFDFHEHWYANQCS